MSCDPRETLTPYLRPDAWEELPITRGNATDRFAMIVIEKQTEKRRPMYVWKIKYTDGTGFTTDPEAFVQGSFCLLSIILYFVVGKGRPPLFMDVRHGHVIRSDLPGCHHRRHPCQFTTLHKYILRV